MDMSSTAREAVKRVIIYRLGSLGDTVIALPALHLIAQAFPQAERRMLTSFPPNMKAPASSAILEHTGLVQGFFRYTYGTRKPQELLGLWWELAKWRPQVLVYLGGDRSLAAARRDALFCRLSGAFRVVGVPTDEDMQHSRQLGPESASALTGMMYEHESSRLARNIAELGDAKLDEPASWDLHLTPGEHARAVEVLSPLGDRPFLALSLGTKNQSNEWGAERWSELLGRVAELYPGHAAVICGAASERELSEIPASGWRDRSSHPLLNLCGSLSPRETAAVFMRAAVFLGHDSGPIHLAAAVQTPCVGIYGARHLPGMWFPYGRQHKILYHHVDCAGCGLQTCIVQQKRCILSISVEEVLAHLRQLLPSAERQSPNPSYEIHS